MTLSLCLPISLVGLCPTTLPGNPEPQAVHLTEEKERLWKEASFPWL